MRVLFCVGFPIDLNDEISGTGNWISSLIKSLLITDNLEIEIALCFIDHKAKSFHIVYDEKIKIYIIPTFKGSRIKMLFANYALLDPYKHIHTEIEKIVQDFEPNIIQIFGYESQFVRLFGKVDIPIIIHFQGFKKALDYKFFQRVSKKELAIETSIKDWLLGSSYFFSRRSSIITSNTKSFDTKQVKYVLGRTDWDRLVTKAVSPNAHYFFCQELLRKPFYQNFWVYPENTIFQLFTITGGGSTKNVDMIYEVSDLLDKYHPGFNYRWRIAGIDDSNIIVKIMKKRGFNSKSIQLLGKLGSDHLINEMIKCKLYVYPSGMDNSPNALMEAMLLGVPVLSNYSGGIDSIVEHRKTGYLVNEGEPYAMAGAIVELSSRKELLIELGKNSRELSLKRNSTENILVQLLSNYSKVLEIENNTNLKLNPFEIYS